MNIGGRIARTLGGVVVVAVMAAFAVTGYVYYDIHNACRVGDFRIVQDEKEFAPAGRVVCGDRKGFFWTEVGGDDSFVTMSLGTDDPFNKRFEFAGGGIFLDGHKCELEDH